MKLITLINSSIFCLLFLTCNSQEVAEKIVFNNPYKFNSAIEQKVKEDTVSWKYQISAGEYASKGDFKNALRNWSMAFGGADKKYNQTEIDSINENYKIVPAKDFIIQQSKSERVIIINEAHHFSSHRVFTQSLLQDLYKNGYRNLGVEALSNGNKFDENLNNRNYPLQESGYYIKDPNFANMLRTALKLGFNVFAYEQTGNLNGKEREILQAKNIQSLMTEKPNEKFLIYCGFDHALEGAHKSWGKAMAGRLKEFTGIDPLTINQVKYSERYNRDFNQPLLKALDIVEPSVLVDSDKNAVKYQRKDAWSDIAVLHPNTKYEKERPQWLIKNDSKYVEVKNENLKIDYPIMALAYNKGENINEAIPVDIVEIQNKSDKSYFVLDKGYYNIVIDNQNDQSFKYEIEVK
ncbi:hypothetical protein [Christiangramia echinicola]|uniref:Erythromycin esterase n=1 Tax=Christiangramia echinicola TaxID=279359 RepID=A0A1H1KUC3_9FLAO|nr:hypothetical protein [Christiangramia echinicola]SDR65846.1 hypothetical protein SAMN04488552_0203 [Christiangramia echinicola]